VGCLAHAGIALLTVARAPRFSLFLLPSVLHMLLAAGAFLVRDRPHALVRDPMGRVVAYVGAFGLFVFAQVATTFYPQWLTRATDPGMLAASMGLGLVGVFMEIWAIGHLRQAFSTEPAARRLVTTGPYRFSRHPVYSGAMIAQTGLVLGYPTLPVLLAVIGWAVCIRLRMHYEEATLSAAFPEYARYRTEVGALLPMPRPLGARG
jgi:protein-S-isoprenylcysteine O-methyltransferase Ste14